MNQSLEISSWYNNISAHKVLLGKFGHCAGISEDFHGIRTTQFRGLFSVRFISRLQKVQADLSLCPSIFLLCSSARQVCICSRGGSGGWHMFCPPPYLVCLTLFVPYAMSCLNRLGHERTEEFCDELSSRWILERHWLCCTLRTLGAWHCCRLAWSFWTHIYLVSFSLDVWVALNGLKVFLEVKWFRLLEYVLNNWLLKQEWQSFVSTNVFHCTCLFWTLLLNKALHF